MSDTRNGTNGIAGPSGGERIGMSGRGSRPHDLVRVSSVDAGRDLLARSSAYGSSYDDVSTSTSTSEEEEEVGGGGGGLAEAERRRLGAPVEEAPYCSAAGTGTTSSRPAVHVSSGNARTLDTAAATSAASASTRAGTGSIGGAGGGVRGSVRDQLIGVQHPQESQPFRGGSLRRNRQRRRDSYDGEDDFSGSDGESSYFSEHQPSPKSGNTTPTAAAMAAAAAAAAKQHASGVPPPGPPVSAGAAAGAHANTLPQVPSLGMPYLSHQQQLAGSSMDNLDTSLSFSDDDDDNGGGTGSTNRLGLPSQQSRPHHNVPRLHRRSSSDEQLQLYTRTLERGTSGQSVSSIVSSSSDEAAGPEPAVYNATVGTRGAPPTVSIPSLPRGVGSRGDAPSGTSNSRGNPRTPRDPSEAAYNTDGGRQPIHSQTSSNTGLDDSTVFSSSATSPSSEFTSSTSSDPSVRRELRDVGVQGSFEGEGAENGRSSGRRKPTNDVGEITGATPTSIDGRRQQASSRRSLQPPHLSISSEGAQATAAAYPRAERMPPVNHDQVAQTWISMAPVPSSKPLSSPGDAHSSSRWSAADRSSSVLSSAASRTASDGGHTSNPSRSTLIMHYSEDDEIAGGGRFSRQADHAMGSVSRSHNADGRLPEDGRLGNRRAIFADSKTNCASGKESHAGDVIAGDFRVYSRRWVMLMYMSVLNLLSDWTCYSVAPIAVLSAEAFGAIDPESLVTIFLSANAVASGLEPIILGRLGLRRTVVFGSLLLMLGSIVKSGGLPLLMPSTLEKGHGEWRVYVGFFLVGLSQPLYQCTPALLSASWFPEKERTLATGVGKGN